MNIFFLVFRSLALVRVRYDFLYALLCSMADVLRVCVVCSGSFDLCHIWFSDTWCIWLGRDFDCSFTVGECASAPFASGFFFLRFVLMGFCKFAFLIGVIAGADILDIVRDLVPFSLLFLVLIYKDHVSALGSVFYWLLSVMGFVFCGRLFPIWMDC